jgi:hypothetical protein
MTMPGKRSPFDLMLFFRECNKEHTQKVIRSLLASDRSAWKGSRNPELLRQLSSLVFSPTETRAKSPRRPPRTPTPKPTRLAPPLRLGGRHDRRTALDEPVAATPPGGARSRSMDADQNVKDLSARGPTGSKPPRAERRSRPGPPR